MYWTYFSSYIFSYLKISERKFGYSNKFWLLENFTPLKLTFFKIFSPKKAHFFDDKDILLRFLWIFKTLFSSYNKFKFVLSYKIIYIYIFNFLFSFLCRVILKPLKNFTKSFDPQDTLTLWNNTTNFLDPQEPF